MKLGPNWGLGGLFDVVRFCCRKPVENPQIRHREGFIREARGRGQEDGHM